MPLPRPRTSSTRPGFSKANPTWPLGNLLVCLTSLIIKKKFLMSHLNLNFFSLKLLLQSLQALVWSVYPSFLQAFLVYWKGAHAQVVWFCWCWPRMFRPKPHPTWKATRKGWGLRMDWERPSSYKATHQVIKPKPLWDTVFVRISTEAV